jgi:hypothetical protein
MTEQEYLDSKNIVTEYVEDFTDRNGWKNISLTTLLKDYKKQLTLTDVGCSKRFEKQDLLKAYQAGVIEQKSINLDTFDFKKLKELQHDSSEWYERYTE